MSKPSRSITLRRERSWAAYLKWVRRNPPSHRSRRESFAHLRALTAKDRSIILRRWFELIMANQDDLARLEPREQGKPLAEAKGEIASAASFIDWLAEEGKRVYGDIISAINRTNACWSSSRRLG